LKKKISPNYSIPLDGEYHLTNS